MNVSDLQTSRFLKRSDVGPGMLVSIRAISQENVAKEGADSDLKTCLHFNELEKPMVLNSTNAQIIARITGQEEDIEKNWLGKFIVVYDDPNVTFGQKLVGGLRVRSPKPGTKLPEIIHPATGAHTQEEDDLPF
jgi:hypothetical protein